MHAFPALERDEKPLDVLFPTMQRLELNLLRKDKEEKTNFFLKVVPIFLRRWPGQGIQEGNVVVCFISHL